MFDRQDVARIIRRTALWLSVAVMTGEVPASEARPRGPESASPAVSEGLPAGSTRQNAAAPDQAPAGASSVQEAERVVQRRAKAGPGDRERVSRRPEGAAPTYANGLIAMAIVLGMIAAGAVAFKRWGGRFRAAVGAGGRNMEVVSRLALSPRQSVCLIRLGRQLVLVGVAPDQVSNLLVIDDPEAVAELMASLSGPGGKASGSTFGRLFSREATKFDDLGEEVGPPAEVPLGSDGRHYRRVRSELAGLLDRLRSRQTGGEERAEESSRVVGRGPIAIA
jgi:flagellar biogenesis protein FliO